MEEVKIEGKKLHYIVTTLQGSNKNKKVRQILLRHMFFKNFRLIFAFYKNQFRRTREYPDKFDQKQKD